MVKLCQMRAGEEGNLVIREALAPESPSRVLYEDASETVRYQTLAPGEDLHVDGLEILVLDGTITLDGEAYGGLSWLRFPSGAGKTIRADAPVRLWMKKRDDL